MAFSGYIKKRDGSIVPFDQNKIFHAIRKAVQAVGEHDQEPYKKIMNQAVSIIETIFKNDIPTVENIQDLVEKLLIESGNAKVAKAYILYREKRAEVREVNTVISETIDLIDNYLKEVDWRVNENSNTSYSLQGLNFHISSSFTSHYWLHKIYPPEVREAHLNGDFHIHDLGILGTYCVGWDLMDFLKKGFTGVFGKVASKPPKHFRTALGQLVNLLYTLQGESAGAQAVASFDTLLAPFIRYDGLSYDVVKQCMQEFVFNMNVPTRVGFQSPFSNITLDLVVPSTLAEEKIIIGGKPQKESYKEFQNEMDLLNRAFCEIMLEGDASGRPFSFPIPTYNITKDFEWNNPKLQPLWEMTRKYGVPYFANFINSDMNPEDARSMCCRLRLDNRELRKRGGGLFGANPLTGSIGVVTINLPAIAYTTKNKTAFFEKLEQLMITAKSSLEIKRKIIEELTARGLYPYAKYYLSEIKMIQGSYWHNHFSTIGLIGMNEACLNLFGNDLSDPESHGFAVEMMNFMREKIAEYQEETGHFYNLEATPAEGTSYNLALKDKKRFPDIISSGEVEPYYTNSTQLPVDFTEDVFEALEHQDSLQSLYTGGTVLHLFIGEKISDADQVKFLVKKIFENYTLPYISIAPTYSICPVHGYVAGEHHQCPYLDVPEVEEIKKDENKKLIFLKPNALV
ncbi:MAG TPA: ribonucleoside triphosphate reductase [Spirochaetia bacterium]|nr:MAG: ribonucleoside triphosphate reductase [Spirochaetes bacterium GWB1_36_13]HCL56551.1 ribonucleoside triphosphate reductase [Spirochaetia bacterium]